MSWFPVVAAEIAETEAALGIALPVRYKARLLDSRVHSLLSHRIAGTFKAGISMLQFSRLTNELKVAHPEFPREGVVASVVLNSNDDLPHFSLGYWRFWLPDKKNPGRLGETLYSWDTIKRRTSRYCSNDQFVDGIIGVVHRSDPEFLETIGYPIPLLPEEVPLFKVRSFDSAIDDQLRSRPPDMRTEAGLSRETLSAGLFQVRGSHISVCDLGQIPRAAAKQHVPVVPGLYEIRVVLAASRAGTRTVMRSVQLIREGISPDGRTKAFDVNVDLAAVSIFDRQDFSRRVSVDERESLAMEMMEIKGMPCIGTTRKGAEFIVVPSGDGDGSYPVYRLTYGGEVAGIEICFT